MLPDGLMKAEIIFNSCFFMYKKYYLCQKAEVKFRH